MSATARKASFTALGVLIVAALIGAYVSFLTNGPTPYRVPVANAASGQKTVNLTLQTVAGAGTTAPNHDWVSYLVDENGTYRRSTVWTLPANALVHVTIYNFDTMTGLRNPFLGQARGIVGGTFGVDGKPTQVLNPDEASHTFAIPDYNLIVPIKGIPDNAKNPCAAAPCSLSNDHETITFSFRTGKPGHYRWQCFVPCAFGFVYGFGGPMQTIGYMDGYVNVV